MTNSVSTIIILTAAAPHPGSYLALAAATQAAIKKNTHQIAANPVSYKEKNNLK